MYTLVYRHPHRICPICSILILLFPISVLVFGAVGSARADGGGSLYSDIKASKVGDVLTVLIFESSSASNRAETSTKKGDAIKGNLAASGAKGIGALSFLPLYGAKGSVTAGVEKEYKGTGATSRSGTLTAQISVMVTEVKENGNLVIKGERVIEVNREKQIITLTGEVRPEDISSDNTVHSYNIANARISYTGKGIVSTAKRPGLLARIFNWLF